MPRPGSMPEPVCRSWLYKRDKAGYWGHTYAIDSATASLISIVNSVGVTPVVGTRIPSVSGLSWREERKLDGLGRHNVARASSS